MAHSSQDLSILNAIRSKLWDGHASVMVGSGFSRNADRGTNTLPLPPSWRELAEGLAQELYAQSSRDEINRIVGKKSALQLAQEYETHLGRNALNDFIKKTISDANLMPNELFTQFLELPWNDVFTTNYDTLLERAAQGVWDRKYDVVYACQDLALAETPRIVKLHGSLTSLASPLIVTEEDYRTYPQKFAPFVNTVQQTLMENSLCLVGFSGTDPNFLSWLGWVRDNLGDAMPRVYLLAVSPMPEIEKNVFREKNVIVVDLACLDINANENGGSRLKNLCRYLKEQRTGKNGEWRAGLFASNPGEHSRHPTPDGIKDMEKRRKAYPCWLVMPANHRDNLCDWEDLEVFDITGLEQLPPPWDLKGLYEFNWCREKCLLPLWDVAVYRTILERYHPFVSVEKGTEQPECPSAEIRQIWMDLQFAVYRFYREQKQIEAWEVLDKQLAALVGDNVDWLNRLAYERVMMAFVRCDLKAISDAVKRWNEIERSPYWSVKHAAILFEIGEDEKGIAELENTLSLVRPFIPKGRIKNDYAQLSLEGAILCALDMAEARTQVFKNGQKDEEFEKIRQRLRELAAFQCNPLDEADRFQTLMSVQETPDVGFSTRRNFDTTIESIKTKRGLSASFKNAVQCARFFEDSCLPLYVGIRITNLTTALRGCVARLASSLPDWAFALFCRLGAGGEMDEELFLSQRQLANWRVEQIDQFASMCLQQIRYLMTEWGGPKAPMAPSYQAKVLGEFLEILSRLVSKASAKIVEEVFDVGIMTCKSTIPGVDLMTLHLCTRFFPRVIQAMDGKLLFNKIFDLLYLASPAVAQSHRFWQNPFMGVEWNGFSVPPEMCPNDLTAKIDMLIEQVKTGSHTWRTHAFVILDRLHGLGILGEEQLRHFGNNILCHTGKDGMPDFGLVYPHGYLRYLAPSMERKHIEDLVRNKFLTFDFKLHPLSEGGWSFWDENFEHVVDSMLDSTSVFAANPQLQIDLTSDDAMRLFRTFCTGFSASLEDARQRSNRPTFPGRGKLDVFKKYLERYDKVLGEIIVPRLDESTRQKAETWWKKMRDCENLCLPIADLALHGKDAVQRARITQEIMMAVSEEDKWLFNIHLQAYAYWVALASKGELPAAPQELQMEIIDVLGMRTGDFFGKVCRILRQVAESMVLTPNAESMLMASLVRLEVITRFSSKSQHFPLESRADDRESAACLAGRLYQVYGERNQAIPLALTKWKEVGDNPEELLSVRQAWRRGFIS